MEDALYDLQQPLRSQEVGNCHIYTYRCMNISSRVEDLDISVLAVCIISVRAVFNPEKSVALVLGRVPGASAAELGTSTFAIALLVAARGGTEGGALVLEVVAASPLSSSPLPAA